MNIIIYTLQMEQQLNELNELHARLKIVTDNIKKTCDELVYWKKIDGYDYSVSKNGEVRNDKTMRILKLRLNSGYLKVDILNNTQRKTQLVHRLVANAFLNNPQNKRCVDHINNDRTDNNIKNLRFATDIENSRNAPIRKDNKTNVKGVNFDKRYQKWRARIVINKKDIHLGYYKTIDQAKEARQKKAKELFGEFLNECEL